MIIYKTYCGDGVCVFALEVAVYSSLLTSNSIIAFLLFFPFVATSVAYGSSQARGQVRAASGVYAADMATPDLS